MKISCRIFNNPQTQPQRAKTYKQSTMSNASFSNACDSFTKSSLSFKMLIEMYPPSNENDDTCSVDENSMPKDELEILKFLNEKEGLKKTKALAVYEAFCDDWGPFKKSDYIYNADDRKSFNKKDYETYKRLKTDALNAKNTSPITRYKTEKFFNDNPKAIKNCTKLAGEKGFIEALNMDFKDFKSFVRQTSNLYTELSNYYRFNDWLMWKTNPAESLTYMFFAEQIEKDKESIKSLKKEKTLSVVPYIDNQITETKKRIKKNQIFLKKLDKESIKSPKDVIEKLSLLSQILPKLNTDSFFEYLKFMDTSTPRKKERFDRFINKINN